MYTHLSILKCIVKREGNTPYFLTSFLREIHTLFSFTDMDDSLGTSDPYVFIIAKMYKPDGPVHMSQQKCLTKTDSTQLKTNGQNSSKGASIVKQKLTG